MRKNMERRSSGRCGRSLYFLARAGWGCLTLILCFAQATAQPVDFTYKTYGLEVDADNVIQNDQYLDDFYEKLYQLQLTNQGEVSIVHIGDSHIQADYLTSVVRRNFQKDFGNAGRGLIVPLNVAGTNEPNNFKTESNVSWKAKRCVFPSQPLPIGIGGVTIETTDPSASLRIFMNDLWLDYSFNRLTLFYEKDDASFDFSVRGPRGRELGVINAGMQPAHENVSSIEWRERINSITIQAVKSSDDQSRALIYGLVLENSTNGVLYNTIGVNGAKFSHYNQASGFAAQTAALHPDLFIISLGTNESLRYPNVDKALYGDIEKLISTLRAVNAGAKFILVTPQDAFRNRNKPNPGILQVRKVIIRYAVDNGLAFYDMYRATGGAQSAEAWSKNALLGNDGVHLTRDGYEYEGNLFYDAMMKGYNLYVPGRRP
jgi:lysophospholipase L1-like esterase